MIKGICDTGTPPPPPLQSLFGVRSPSIFAVQVIICPKFSFFETDFVLANSEGLSEMPHRVVFHLGLAM